LERIPYARQWIGKDDIASVVEALQSIYLTQGPLVEEFEKKVANYCGAKYAVAVNSGTSALHAACFAADVCPGAEVITSPITFAATANCILYCGGKPVFADILEDTVCIDPAEIEKKISKTTKVIIPVHYAGHPCELKEIKAIADQHGLIVIEDAAHALGAEYEGNRIGSCNHSDMTIFSFHAIKHITTGEGGMILTNSSKYYEKLLRFRSHGITRDNLYKKREQQPWFYEMQSLGFNYRLTDFQCALGISQFAKLREFLKRRRKIVNKYQKAFSKIKSIKLPVEKTSVKSAWHIYPIQIKDDRKKTFNALKQKGIGVNVHYIPVYLHPFYKELGYEKGLCPKAESYYEKTLTLPLFPKMSDKDVEHVIRMVLSILGE
jgi:perosamine synthetase